ncbi:MAG: hypothetical protein IIB77_05360 [Proteobacteria bacterium]|nr:hypothetical protein [Pseudomonadota bacterium]
MDMQEKENRIDALHEAARHRLADETADVVVANAEKYFEFLRGNEKNDS